VTDLLATRIGTLTAWLVGTLAAVAVAAMLLPAPGTVRATSVLVFAFVGPGAALAGLLRIRTVGAWAAVTLGGSITVGVLSSELAALAGWWQPRALLVALAAVSASAGVLALRLDDQRSGTEVAA
jgi:hypothetical protein